MGEVREVVTCPNCGSATTELYSVEPGMRVALAKVMDAGSIPGQICKACYSQLTSQVSQGAKLRIEQQMRDKNRAMMWKSRVNLIKHARTLMAQKSYPEAAMNYEKYIRVLEVSFDKKSGELTPEIFGKSARSKELSVIATAYWDLMRIYDTNPAYRDRMLVAGRKLAMFLPFSPLFPDVIAKAQAYLASAKNPDIVKKFLKDTKSQSRKCFVATSAFADQDHPTVDALREFRDRHLITNPLGLRFVFFYYRHSHQWATWLDAHPRLRRPVRTALHAFIKIIYKFS